MSEDRLTRLEARLAELERRLGAVESRWSESGTHPAVATDSGRVSATRPAAATRSDGRESSGSPPDETSEPAMLPRIGRTLLVMGGAFLLRAATDAGTLPTWMGVTAGLVYGVIWLALSYRAARAGDELGASFHGVASALVIFPLLVEATLEFEVLPYPATGAIFAALWGAGATAAYRLGLRPLAWIFCAGGGVAGLVLMMGSGFYPPFAWMVLGIALGGLWLGYLRSWGGLAVVGSAVADFLVLATTLIYVLRPETLRLTHLTPGLLFSLQIGLIVLYLGSYLVRALVQHAHVSVPEMMQAVTTFAIGVAGALYVLRVEPQFSLPFGILAAVVGLVCYAVSFLYVDRRVGRRRNFAFFTSAALVAVLLGSTLLLNGLTLTACLLALAIGAAALGAHHGRATLSLHAAVYVVAAAVTSGLLWMSLDALVGAPAPTPDARSLAEMAAVIVVALTCCSARVITVGKTWGRWSRTPKGIDLFVLSFGLVGLIVVAASRLFTVSEDPGFDAGAVAALRTGTLALAATLLGLLSMRSKFREAARLVPVFLAFGALTLLLGDLREGRPVTLVFSLVLYGSALIFAPRLARAGRRRTAN